jgi:hypothetical protein
VQTWARASILHPLARSVSLPPSGRLVTATVEQVLESLVGEFADFADSFSHGEYLMWLGSGISRSVVPNVHIMLRRLLEFLQARVDPTNATCRYKKALNKILDVAGVPDSTRSSIDINSSVATWPSLSDTIERMVGQYADVLNVHVQGESADFLVWDGLDVANTYGSVMLKPAVEHYCIAILMLEGLVTSAPTTNWDGLVEVAVKELGGSYPNLLNVVVEPADFRAARTRSELVKFHGCAVRALHDPGKYRSRIIARRTQIDNWATDQDNAMMRNHLVNLFASRPALVLGLSTQDANIHAMLHRARLGLPRAWPANPPSVVFAEESLHHHHQAVLGATYGDDIYAADCDEIESKSLLGAYARPTLVALTIFSLAAKLGDLIDYAPNPMFDDASRGRLRADLRDFCVAGGRLADLGDESFVAGLAGFISLAGAIFRGTARLAMPRSYLPLTSAPIRDAVSDPDFPSHALGRLAVVVSLLARGAQCEWGLAFGRPEKPGGGSFRMVRNHQCLKIFIVRNGRALAQLEAEGLVRAADPRAIVITTETMLPGTTRFSGSHYGRTGKSGARYIDTETLFLRASAADDLFDDFRLEAAL